MTDEEYILITEKYIDTVYKVALSSLRNESDAQDIVQNTFMKLLLSKKDFTDEVHLKRWLIRVAVNECKSFHTSYWRKNVDSLEASFEETGTEPASKQSQRSEAQMDLWNAMGKLPDRCRIVTHLFYYEDYSTKEIADILHIHEATVRTRLVRARKILKDSLKEAWENE